MWAKHSRYTYIHMKNIPSGVKIRIPVFLRNIYNKIFCGMRFYYAIL